MSSACWAVGGRAPTATLSPPGRPDAPTAGPATTVSYAKGGTELVTAAKGTAAAQTLPPYSITTLQLKPASAPSGYGTSKAPTAAPVAAVPVASASSTIGTRAQATAAGTPADHPARSTTAGGLASTGMSNAVTLSAVGGLAAISTGCVLVLRGRRSRGAHGK